MPKLSFGRGRARALGKKKPPTCEGDTLRVASALRSYPNNRRERDGLRRASARKVRGCCSRILAAASVVWQAAGRYPKSTVIAQRVGTRHSISRTTRVSIRRPQNRRSSWQRSRESPNEDVLTLGDNVATRRSRRSPASASPPSPTRRSRSMARRACVRGRRSPVPTTDVRITRFRPRMTAENRHNPSSEVRLPSRN